MTFVKNGVEWNFFREISKALQKVSGTNKDECAAEEYYNDMTAIGKAYEKITDYACIVCSSFLLVYDEKHVFPNVPTVSELSKDECSAFIKELYFLCQNYWCPEADETKEEAFWRDFNKDCEKICQKYPTFVSCVLGFNKVLEDRYKREKNCPKNIVNDKPALAREDR